MWRLVLHLVVEHLWTLGCSLQYGRSMVARYRQDWFDSRVCLSETTRQFRAREKISYGEYCARGFRQVLFVDDFAR